jgi:hypothetical protein
MEGLPEYVWVFAGSVIAALIVLFSGWLQQKISRASTVSGYRQKWIQDIRKAFSAYMDELERLFDMASSNSQFDHPFGACPMVLDDTRSIRKLRNYIQERRCTWIFYLDEARSLENYLTDTARKLNEYERRRDELAKSFQDILKEEWDRVKNGIG